MTTIQYNGKAYACWNKEQKERPWSIKLVNAPHNGTIFQCIYFTFIGVADMVWCKTDEMKTHYSMPGSPSGVIKMNGEFEISDAEELTFQ